MPVAAAALVLAAALSAYVMVKFYGVIFLGQYREPRLAEARDEGTWARAGPVWLSVWCVLLGILPAAVIRLLDNVTLPLVNFAIGSNLERTGWLLIAPVSPERSSYGPLLFLLGIVGAVLLTYVLVRRFYHGRERRGDAWQVVSRQGS